MVSHHSPGPQTADDRVRQQSKKTETEMILRTGITLLSGVPMLAVLTYALCRVG